MSADPHVRVAMTLLRARFANGPPSDEALELAVLTTWDVHESKERDRIARARVAVEGLRRGHEPDPDHACPTRAGCWCGSDEHNARVDALADLLRGGKTEIATGEETTR